MTDPAGVGAMKEIEAGAVVQLRSGGPKMTVNKVEGSEAVCNWFDGNKAQTAIFELVLLKFVE